MVQQCVSSVEDTSFQLSFVAPLSTCASEDLACNLAYDAVAICAVVLKTELPAAICCPCSYWELCSDIVYTQCTLDTRVLALLTSTMSSSLSAPAISIQNTMGGDDFLPHTTAMTANGGLLIPPPPPYRPGSPALSDRSTPYSSPAASPVPSPGASPLHSPFYSPCPSPTPPIHRSNPSGMYMNMYVNSLQPRIIVVLRAC